MIDIKQYLEQTNTVLLTKDAFEYLKERASVPDKVKAEYDPSADLISREKTLTAFADYVGSGMSMNDFDALWDIVAKMPAVKQEPRFIAKSDGTIEQIKECTEQEPCDKCVYSTKDGDCQYDDVTETIPPFEPCGDAISREHTLAEFKRLYFDDKTVIRCAELVLKNEPPVNPQEPKTGHWEQYGNFWEDKFKCSECGKEQPKILCGERIIGHWSDYCPNCGARMVEPQESEDKCKNCEYYRNPDYTRCHECKAESEDKE